MPFGAAMETDTSAFRHVTLCLRVSESAAHKHVFKLLAPVQREEAASRGTA